MATKKSKPKTVTPKKAPKDAHLLPASYRQFGLKGLKL